MLTDAVISLLFSPFMSPSFSDRSADICFVSLHLIFLTNTYFPGLAWVSVVEWLMSMGCVFAEVLSEGGRKSFSRGFGCKRLALQRPERMTKCTPLVH